MTRLSDILNSPVVCKSDCAVLGEVRDAYFDEKCKNIAYFVVRGEYSEKLLPFTAVASFGDAVMVEDAFAQVATADVDFTLYLRGLLGRPVYTGTGKSKGTLKDVCFGASGKVISLQTEEISCSPSSVRAFGDVLLMKDNCGKRKTPRVSFPQAQEDRPVGVLEETIADVAAEPDSLLPRADVPDAEPSDGFAPAGSMPTENNDEGLSPSPLSVTLSPVGSKVSPAPRSDVHAEQPSDYTPVYIDTTARAIPVLFNQEDFTPHRIIADYNFLLGRTLRDDLRSYVGEMLAAKGEKVTVEVVEKARRHGKLIELTLNSR